ncbi:MAG TPA: 2-C-methyl-D-erythritol 2,4-cyclodiphosphate synthase [candidate division Zixibacteria bacterium]|nr:2-C-methyl-D-erythritol 2,4-cyclodiphosphate synthase [candidate division Zixibacteria bacterium]
MTLQLRIGHGVDVHRFAPRRRLVLGGVEIPYPRGLSGHSDADVVLHAVMNAVLGAMGEGDIGLHFPDSDSRTEGIASTELLRSVTSMMKRKRFRVVNLDVTVLAQGPRLAPYYPAMRKKIAALLGTRPGAVNLKAATPEKLGALGAGKGMAAFAVVLLSK